MATNGTREYTIKINGIQENINAVDSLNKQLDKLEERINALNSKSLKALGEVNDTKSSTRVSKQLTEQNKLEKQILDTEKKLEDVRDKNYNKLLHMKEELREYQQIAKSQVASESLSQGLFDPNTMFGMKGQLRSIKAEMQTLDINSDRFKELTAQAATLNNQLKQLEQGYGQYGRNVGNYANGVVEGMNRIKVTVGDTVREYNNYRQAVKALREERMSLSQTLGRESEQYKQIDIALKTLESDYKDLNLSSRWMDNMLDTMQGFMGLASMGQGLSMLFGLDDEDFQKTMQKFAAISMTLQGLEVVMQQVQSKQGLLGIGWAKIGGYADDLAGKLQKLTAKFEAWKYNLKNGTQFNKQSNVWFGIDADDILKIANKRTGFERIRDSITKSWAREYEAAGMGAQEAFLKAEKRMHSLIKSVNLTTRAFKVLRTVISTVITGGLLLFLPDIIEGISNLVKNLNHTKVTAENAEMALNTLNRTLKTQMDLLSSQYLSKEISDQEYLKKVYDAQTNALVKQIDALQERAKTLKESFNFRSLGNVGNFFTSTQNVEFRGQKFNGTTTVGHGRLGALLKPYGNDLNITVKSIQEVENAWMQCNEALKNGNDYFTQMAENSENWAEKLVYHWNGLSVTMKDTEEVMRGMGNIKLSDTIAEFQRINDQFAKNPKNVEEYRKGLERLRKEMNSNEILQSVIANLDKYIPDEKVRTAVQNIINEIYRLDDAFNMTSPEQVHYWNQVRIDAMKDGYAKAKAQIDENERYEKQQRAHTEEQQKLLEAKYARQRQEARERYAKQNQKSTKNNGKKEQDILNELEALRIENMKDGEEKAIKQLEHQRDVELQKAKEYGQKYYKLFEDEIKKKYQKKIADEERKWLFERLKVYEDFLARIDQMNKATFEKETSTATQKVCSRGKKDFYQVGYDFITPNTFDNSRELEKYYKEVVKIQEEAAKKEEEIRQDNLERMLDFDKKEEELRHKRLIDINGGDYIQQLRAGLITQEEYDDLIEREEYAHTARMNALQREYEAQSSASTEEYLESIYSMYDTYWGNIIGNIRNDYNNIGKILDKQPIRDKGGWGVVNIGATSTAYNKALDMYDNLKNDIIKKQMELARALNEHRITPEDFAMRQGELKEEMESIDAMVLEVRMRQRELVGEFMQSIQQYIQAGLQAVSELMRSIWENQDASYEYEMNRLEKQIDEYAELLDKQEEITREHADNINDIEDELSSARGDRRQHLIDQLNAEMQAQRESIAAEKRAEKEKEKLEKKKEEEELKQRKREHDRQVTQAFINWHLSIANALATQPFMPVGIAMGALATALGAVQYALVKNQKYADGGVLVGKSHKDGGIPVLGGRAEVEGNEFITNKRTTQQNVDLLYFINSKKKKLDLNDFIDFYGNGGIRRNIQSISRGKYADGGVLPTLRTDIDVNSRLVTAMEDYSNRPVQVAVVDIIDKTQQVNNVKVMAGLNAQ